MRQPSCVDPTGYRSLEDFEACASYEAQASFVCPTGNFSEVHQQCSDAGYATPIETVKDASNEPYGIPLTILKGYNIFTPSDISLIPLQRGDFFKLSQPTGKVAIDRGLYNKNKHSDYWLKGSSKVVTSRDSLGGS